MLATVAPLAIYYGGVGWDSGLFRVPVGVRARRCRDARVRGVEASRSGATKHPVRKASTLSEPTAHIAARCHDHTDYCSRCDLLVGLGELHVIAVEFDHDIRLLTVRGRVAQDPDGLPDVRCHCGQPRPP